MLEEAYRLPRIDQQGVIRHRVAPFHAHMASARNRQAVENLCAPEGQRHARLVVAEVISQRDQKHFAAVQFGLLAVLIQEQELLQLLYSVLQN
ncbi:hypothetical protein EYF80_001780 [Liparis tanakae]|uniref:Uncharacterized protein n=1 Tax=Liparis tanakae TaxID=230148 RepID=A0A4Z2JC88_9TELE|nr:hypothetical protein EYF80_001780 [Liparis tanakae]